MLFRSFANAAGIPQNVMDFQTTDGTKVDFNENAGRVLSTTDVQNICKRDYGLDVSEADAKAMAGGTYTSTGNDDINRFADKKARDAYFTVVGKQPTDAQVSQILRSGNVVNSATDAAINGLDLPPDYVSPGATVDQKISFGQAYAAARAAYGAGQTFKWTDEKGVTREYTTENREEQKARLDRMALDDQARINMMPASDIAGAGRGFLGGRPANVENLYYAKNGNVYVDTRTFDAMGRVTSGDLKLADDQTATNVRATNILTQLAATGAQGIGELMQNYANAVALATGSDMNNVVYKLGKSIEQWGQDRDAQDVVDQSKNIEKAIAQAGKTSNIFDQAEIIAKAVKDNPLGFISSVGKEVVQEAPPWAMGAVAGAVALAFGTTGVAAATTAAAISAVLDGVESFGSGGREVYDELKKAGVPEIGRAHV